MTMLAWSEWRNAAVAVAWLTVGGGLLLATIWALRGGFTATGPEDDLMDHGRARRTTRARHPRATSFGAAQVVMHGLLGILTASLITYAATLRDDRTGGYVFIIAAIALTMIPGLRMFWKWRSNARPAVAESDPRLEEERSEDHLPRPVVYLHGLAAFGTLALLVLLVVKDT